MNPINDTFVQKVKIINGRGSLKQLGALLQEIGYRKAFLVFDQGMQKTGWIDKAVKSLEEAGIDYVKYDKVVPDPSAQIIDEGADICKAKECDCVIGLGGGSSIDTAKGINILRFNAGKILEYQTKPMQLCTGLITIPTTSGTGSELSNGAIITDTKTNKKAPILCANNMSEYAILDPELTVAMPYNLTLMTGLDVFSHALEAYTTVAANPLTDLICEKLMETVVIYLPKALENPDDMEAREKMQCAASIGGWMLYSVGSHVGHSIAHVLGAHFHIAHGAACAYGVPAVLQMIAPAATKKVSYVGQLFGVHYTGLEDQNEVGKLAAEAYQNFVKDLRLPTIETAHFSVNLTDLAEEIVQEPFAAFTPVKVDQEHALMMLQEILQA